MTVEELVELLMECSKDAEVLIDIQDYDNNPIVIPVDNIIKDIDGDIRLLSNWKTEGITVKVGKIEFK